VLVSHGRQSSVTFVSPGGHDTRGRSHFGSTLGLCRADAAAAMDNMHNSELYGRVS
jgi:hypothetical protein